MTLYVIDANGSKFPATQEQIAEAAAAIVTPGNTLAAMKGFDATQKAEAAALVSGGAASDQIFVPGESWKNVLSTVAKMSAGTTVCPVVLIWGDSVAQYVAGNLRTALYGMFGGNSYGALGSTSIYQNSGATVVTGDYTYMPNGNHVSIPSGSYIAYRALGAQWFQANTVRGYIVAHPGGGDVRVDVINSGGTVIATQTVSGMSTSVSLVVVNLATAVTTQSVRVTSVSGTNICVGVAAWNSLIPGVVRADLSASGINLVDANNVANPQILSGIIHDLQPVLITYSMREVSNDYTHLADPASWITSPTHGVAALVSKFGAQWSGSAWMFVSPTAALIDAGQAQSEAPSHIEGAALRGVAESLGHSFIDSWRALGNWEQIVARGNPGNDGVHIGPIEQSILGDAALQQIGFGGLSRPTYAQTYNAQSIRVSEIRLTPNFGAAPNGGKFVTNGGGEDVVASLARYFDIRNADNVRAARFSGSGTVGIGAIFASGGLLTSLGQYEADGNYGIHVHPTTGVWTGYCRVGGVLKTIALGTAA